MSLKIKILMVGDLFNGNHMPLGVYHRRPNVASWLEILDELLEDQNNIEHVICGHRDVWPGEQLVQRRDYMHLLWDGVNQIFSEGKDVEEALQRLPLDTESELYRSVQECRKKEGQNNPEAKIEEYHKRTIRAYWHRLQTDAVKEVRKALNEGGIEEARHIMNRLLQADRSLIYFNESEFNRLGHRLLRDGKHREAIEIFKFGILAFPESANLYDSIAEAYMLSGDRERVIQNYEKSLQLDPENKNVKENLLKLRKRY